MKKRILVLFIFIFIFCISATYAADNQTTSNQTNNDFNNIKETNFNRNYENNTQYSIYYMGISNSSMNRSITNITYFSKVLTNIKQGSYFQVILKTPNYNSNGNLIDFEGIPLANKNVTFYINGISYGRMTDSNGVAKIQLNLNSGTYRIQYAFNGDSQYNMSNDAIDINVFIGNTYMLPLEKELYRTETFRVALFDENETRLSNKTILISVNGNTYQRTTDSNGIVGLKINLNPGQYQITYTFNGGGIYQSCSGSCQIFVSMKNIVICPIDINMKTQTAFRTKVTDDMGNPVRNQTIKYTINNVDYNRTTNSEGIARLNINFIPGTYTIGIAFVSTGYNMYYSLNQKTYSINIFGSNNNQYILTSLGNCIQQGTPYQIRLTDSNNNPLSNKKVYLTINNICYSRATDLNGTVKLNINLGVNNYIIGVSCGDSSSLFSYYEMISVTDNQMNNNANVSDNERTLYIITNTSYQCLNDNYIINLANNLTQGITNDLEKAVLIHNYVYRLDYKFNNNGLNNALKAALLNQANCYDQTNLLMALAKSSGLPIRVILGNPTITTSGHVWAQFLIGNKWIVSDPTNTNVLGSWSSNYNGEYYTDYIYGMALDKDAYILVQS